MSCAVATFATGMPAASSAVKARDAAVGTVEVGVRKTSVVVVADTIMPAAAAPPLGVTEMAVDRAGKEEEEVAGKGANPHPVTVSVWPPAMEPAAPDTVVSNAYTTSGFV